MASDIGDIVFDPRGIVEATPQSLAPRLARLEGARLGVLDNTKWNANRLLKRTAAKLEKRLGLGAVTYYRKESFSKDADPALIQSIAAANDVVLTAIGD
jgi:hypothetical protein